ncbi:MAG: ATP-binding protein [Thermoproteota archaeon]
MNSSILLTLAAADLACIRGLEYPKRAVEVAAAGGHSILIVGTAGTGKTLLARALAGLVGKPLQVFPPDCPPSRMAWEFRNGGLFLVYPGLLSGQLRKRLAWLMGLDGILGGDLQVVAEALPCPCGLFEDEVRPCTCTPTQISRYQEQVILPVVEGFDIIIWGLPQVSMANTPRPAETTEQVRVRVEEAWKRQQERRFGRPIRRNAQMGPAEVERFCILDDASRNLLRAAERQLQFSAARCHRVLKVARTIADLAGSENIQAAHLAEALQYGQEKK